MRKKIKKFEKILEELNEDIDIEEMTPTDFNTALVGILEKNGNSKGVLELCGRSSRIAYKMSLMLDAGMEDKHDCDKYNEILEIVEEYLGRYI